VCTHTTLHDMVYTCVGGKQDNTFSKVGVPHAPLHSKSAKEQNQEQQLLLPSANGTVVQEAKHRSDMCTAEHVLYCTCTHSQLVTQHPTPAPLGLGRCCPPGVP
jgi:hypothetical protein